MKFAELLDLVHKPGATVGSPLAADLALITAVSQDLMAAELPSCDLAGLEADYAAHRPRPVTAVVLTRDEEDGIARCLSALDQDADHCLLIDSESGDATVDRALRARGDVRVLSAPWADDFSHHRNLAFGQITDGWLWHVDADEVLAPAHAGRVRRALSALDCLLPSSDFVVSPTIVDVDGPAYTNTQRILRADGPFRFRGRVHEHPYDDRGNTPARVQIDARLDHFGYLPDVIDKRGKRDLYGRLNRLSRAAEPDSPKWVYYEIRDALDYRTASRQDLMAAFTELAAATPDAVPAGVPDHRSERIVDAWILLCELAVRFGGADQIRTYTALLTRAGLTVEATYYRTVLESSRLLGRLSSLVDTISSAETHEEPANRHLMARLFELQSTLALASGRYEAVLPAYRKAVARNAGDSAATDFEMLRQLLSDLRTGPA
ncbi:glycosyltransferase [Streptomyces sp. NPDC051051]|uniref:glycosyltransferase n=1 Tax=Streptomyces sp. NPDC051051 TaxID=3155666 RepID=UPI003438F4ED